MGQFLHKYNTDNVHSRAVIVGFVNLLNSKVFFENVLSDSVVDTKTFYEYEIDLNDEKAKINVFDISLAVRFESNLQELFENL